MTTPKAAKRQRGDSDVADSGKESVRIRPGRHSGDEQEAAWKLFCEAVSDHKKPVSYTHLTLPTRLSV